MQIMNRRKNCLKTCVVIFCVVIGCSSHTQDYLALIASLPVSDKPSYFGLPANIDRSRQRTVSGEVSMTPHSCLSDVVVVGWVAL